MKMPIEDYKNMYVVRQEGVFIYPIKRTIEASRGASAVVQYYVKGETIHSYTEGAYSYDENQQFQIYPYMALKTIYKRWTQQQIDFEMANSIEFNHFVTETLNDYPEYFI